MGIRIKKYFEDGVFSFFLKVLNYIKKKYLGIWRVIILESKLKNTCFKKNTKLKLSFRLATKKDIKEMDNEKYGYSINSKKYFINRLEKGDRCILALYDKKIIGYLWAMKDFMEITQHKHIALSKDKVYLFNAFVLKEFRGQRIITVMHEYICDILKKEGKRIVVLVIDADNKSSLKTRYRCGDKRIGIIIRVRFFGLKYDYINKKVLFYLQN